MEQRPAAQGWPVHAARDDAPRPVAQLTAALGALGEGLVELGLEPPPDLPRGRGPHAVAPVGPDPHAVTLGIGGDAANAAVMAALMGVPARLGGRVGDDALGRRLLAAWRERGVDTSFVVVDGEAPTGIYVNERGSAGLHRFDYHRTGSAGSRLEPGDVGEEFLAGLGTLHLTGITLDVSASSREAALDALERARARGTAVSLAVNHRPALGGAVGDLRAVAETADVVFVSEEEADEVFGDADAEALARSLAARELVLTRGGDGATLVAGGVRRDVPALAVEVTDPAGAGDALAGAYLAARLTGRGAEDALRAGVAAAALSCRARGCALSYPSRDEVDAVTTRGQ